MTDQFEAFADLYRQSCTIAAARCGESMPVWQVAVLPLSMGAAMLVYWASGLSRRVAAAVVYRTHRFWLQAAGVALPIWAAWAASHVAWSLWLHFTSSVGCRTNSGGTGSIIACTGYTSPWREVNGQLWLLPLAVLVCLVIGYLMTRWPKRLWPVPALLWIAYVAAVAAIPSTSIRPLEPGPIHDAVAQLARAESVKMSQIGTYGNPFEEPFTVARVDGIGSGQRIMFGGRVTGSIPAMTMRQNGYMLRPMSIASIRAVTGHELAHVRLRHSLWRLGLSAAVILLLCWGANRLLARRWLSTNESATADRIRLWASLPLLGIAGCGAFVVHDALHRTHSFYQEAEADMVGLDISREPEGFAEYSLLDAAGGRFELSVAERWLTFHPSNADRIRTAIAWQQQHRPGRPVAVPDVTRLLVPVGAEGR